MVKDGAALAGFSLLAGGLWWIYPPIALIVGGGLLLAAAVWGHYYDSRPIAGAANEELGDEKDVRPAE